MPQKDLKKYKEIYLEPQGATERLNFKDVFGRSDEVHIEVGCGKGTFLLSQAQNYPEIDFLGIEWANKYYCLAVDRIGRWGLKNVRIIRADAVAFLIEYVPDESVSCFHIYFPDPWPKKRHHKRRFISNENIRQMLRCLRKGGIINVATDHADYFEQIEKVFCAKEQYIEQIEFISAAGAVDGEVTGTNYERKYIKDGRRIYTIAGRKI